MLCQWDVKHDGLASPHEVVVPWNSRYHGTHYILNANIPLRERDTFLIPTELDYFFPLHFQYSESISQFASSRHSDIASPGLIHSPTEGPC